MKQADVEPKIYKYHDLCSSYLTLHQSFHSQNTLCIFHIFGYHTMFNYALTMFIRVVSFSPYFLLSETSEVHPTVDSCDASTLWRFLEFAFEPTEFIRKLRHFSCIYSVAVPATENITFEKSLIPSLAAPNI